MSHTCSPLLQADDRHLSKHGVIYVESMGHLRLIIKTSAKIRKVAMYWCLYYGLTTIMETSDSMHIKKNKEERKSVGVLSKIRGH